MRPSAPACWPRSLQSRATDRKSTRLNSSHGYISYAVFCLKKKTKHECQVDAIIHLAHLAQEQSCLLRITFFSVEPYENRCISRPYAGVYVTHCDHQLLTL